jgi:hypothetical protein
MKLVCLLAAVTVLTACGGSSAGGADSGIRGRALLGPACPVEPCSVSEPPYTGSFVVRKYGAVVAKVKTDGQGRFEVRLGPGRYVLESESAGLPFLKPVDVTVRAHEFTDVELAFDSGIR